jgi:hypothetical protein
MITYDISGLDNRRREERTPVRLAGRVWYGAKGALWADCTLRNLSPGGARIELPALYELPPRVFFAHGAEKAIFLALLKWRRGDAAGLSFAEAYPFDACTEAPLDRLAADWRMLCN